MTTTNTVLALQLADRWHSFWHGEIGVWILTTGLRIALLLIGGLLAARFINWAAQRVVRRIDAEYQESDALVRSESAKHRQAVASVISWVSVAVLFIIVLVEVTDALQVPVASLVAPAAVLGAALGFGAQRIVQDLLAGFFIITEKQYGFGDLVRLTIAAANEAEGTVEDVTLRVTKLRSSEGEMYTVPNGQIVKALNLSKDWARAVVDIPVPVSADLNVVNDVLNDVAEKAAEDGELSKLLLDKPQLMGVESIGLDTVNLRMVARTLPGKQFDVGRRLRVRVVRALRRAGGSPRQATSFTPLRSQRRSRHPRPRLRSRRSETRLHPGDRDGRKAVAQPCRSASHVDRRADHRVHRAVVGAAGVRAQTGDAAVTRQSGGAARLRARSRVHLGAAHEAASSPHDDADGDSGDHRNHGPDDHDADRDSGDHRDHHAGCADEPDDHAAAGGSADDGDRSGRSGTAPAFHVAGVPGAGPEPRRRAAATGSGVGGTDIAAIA